MANEKIKGLRIGIASPERIREWSYGEVTKSETINYKSLKPEKEGLFDEAIFGPSKDYECACGKYKKVKHRGKKCEKCNVDITEAIVRRERMGHIELAAPVAHIWMTKELPCPSKISLLLDISYKEVDQVVYFVNHIVLDEGKYKNETKKVFKLKEVVDLSSPKSTIQSRAKLRKILREIYEEIKERKIAQKVNYKNDLDYLRAQSYYERLRDSALPFSIEEVFRFVQKHTGIRFGVGAEAIYELLKNIDLNKEYAIIQQNLKKYDVSTDLKAKKLLRRLEAIKWMKESGNKPEWMVLKNIPVTPPDTRPIIQLDGGRFTTSDINNFYRKIIIRNERLKRVLDLNAPSIILNNEKRMLQEAVDALFDNSSRKKPVMGKDKRALKSLSDHLKGKQGLFRQNLLGKRVDYSGRSVIVIGPELKMYQVGIPTLMILKLFKPFIIHELIRKYDDEGIEITPLAPNIRVAESLLVSQDDRIWPVVEKVIKCRPVILNRAPTLHRLGIQAFEPKMIEGKAIQLHPLVTTAFNADFDGDQMAVHVPLSEEAIAEARAIILASWHILGPKDGKPVITPTQDMVLGNYYLTIERKNAIGEGIIFSNTQEIIKAYENKKVHVHALIGISTKAFPEKKFEHEGILITTAGKTILNNALPKDFPYVNSSKTINNYKENQVVKLGDDPRKAISERVVAEALGKKSLSNIVDHLYRNYPIQVVPSTMDKIKSLGFKYSMISATSISAFDVPEYNKKYEYFKEADEKVTKLKKQYQKGLLTDDERYTRVVKLWSNVKEKVTNDIESLVKSNEYKTNSIVIMADSGARGNISNFTQLAGMRGLMSKSYNYDQKRKSKIIKDTIEIPIKHSFIEGLTISEYFNSSYGARKGMTDTAMKTSKSGYMTRKLVDATQEVIITNEDCFTKNGLIVKAIKDTKDENVIETLKDRIENRYSLYDIISPKTKKVLIKANQIILPNDASLIEKQGIEEVTVRSALHCKNKNGICQKCFGHDLSTNEPIEIGTAVGVIAAQSIGEPGTQLTMRTFHTGGVAGGSNITQGFERLKQLFDCIPPKPWEKATISEIAGKVKRIDTTDGYNFIVENKLESLEYSVGLDATPRVSTGDKVEPGYKLTEGSIDISELLKISGIDAVRDYIIKEVQKVYRIQGIEISDKYVEVIIKQLTDKLQILNPGDSEYFIGEIINVNKFREINQELLIDKKQPAVAINRVFGLDDVPSKSGSFLSAASFQDTKKILTDAAAKAQVDYLSGLKENVILGNLIPAGTGIKKSEDILEKGKMMYKIEY